MLPISILLTLFCSSCGQEGDKLSSSVEPTTIPTPQATQPSQIETFTLNGKLFFGTVEVEKYGYPQGQECSGGRGYDDIVGNIPIVVKDGMGRIIATSKTESGKYQWVSSSPDGPLVQCVFSFYPINLSKSDFYVVLLGNRGEMTFSFEDLQNKNWTIEFALGKKY